MSSLRCREVRRLRDAAQRGHRTGCAAGTGLHHRDALAPPGVGALSPLYTPFDGYLSALAAIGRRVDGHLGRDDAGGNLLPILAVSEDLDAVISERGEIAVALGDGHLNDAVVEVQVSPLSVRVTGWLTVTLATFGSAADVCATAPDDNTADRARNAELTRTRELDINATLSTTPGATIALGPAVRYWLQNVGLSQRWIDWVVLFREFGCGHYILCGRIDCFIDLDAKT